MTTARYVARFEKNAIAFRRTLRGTLEAWKIVGFRQSPKGNEYEIFRDGLMFWELSENLLTGWEEDFPGFEQVSWGSLPRPALPDDSGVDDEAKLWEEARDSELVELYSDLADQWEAEIAASLK